MPTEPFRVVRATPPAPEVLSRVETLLPSIFGPATPNRPYFVRRLTAVLVTAALEADAIVGTHVDVWLDPADVASGRFIGPMSRDLETHSLGQGLLFVGAAMRHDAAASDGRCLVRLAAGFAALFDADQDAAERAAAVKAYQRAVFVETGLDIGKAQPSYD